MRAEFAALRDAGHEVRLFSRDSDDRLDQPLYRLRSAARLISGHGDHPGTEVRGFRPDVVHVHNLFPNLSHAWLRSLPIPFVHTLHNFRPFCASSDHYRDGEVCQLCTRQGAWNAVRHRCYHGSAAATAPLALRTQLGIGRDPLFTDAARVIVLSEQVRSELQEAGMEPSRIERWPNFLPSQLDPLAKGARLPGADDRSGYLYVGRLDPAKGIIDLLHSWPDTAPLTVVGSGPAEATVAALAADRPQVRFLGSVSRDEALALMLRSAALVFPSRCLEGSATPLVYVEALACGLPVLASAPNALAPLVERSRTGISFDSIRSLTQALDGAAPACPDPGMLRAVFESSYTEDSYLARAGSLYARVVAEHHASNRIVGRTAPG